MRDAKEVPIEQMRAAVNRVLDSMRRKLADLRLARAPLEQQIQVENPIQSIEAAIAMGDDAVRQVFLSARDMIEQRTRPQS